ncbi:membrane protein insertion efficiency factor YidD [Streptococcus thoraltensis]|uniref:membrane protein insertion efficiency factor YidD n=1 Tax=Streptococcus thoraltensis TaxID=55085 RepID=UPI001F5AAD64|nr:membrane protein insertion efficiency factor YidD [Streptococcus thoraltensis]
MRKVLIAVVRFYQKYLSPVLPGTCRFRPTCSQYMIEAIDKHGFKGIMMGIARILRCHPCSKTGFDPVPDHFSLKTHVKNDSQK